MTQLAFYLAAAVTLFSAIGVVSARNVVHAALFLLLSLAGVAGLFVLLYAEFLALVQILIYGGAVTIVILFALMLTKNEEFENQSDNRRRPFALAAALILFLFMAFAFVTDAEKFQSENLQSISLDKLAETLFVDWVIPFEIASIVLVIALVGAIVIGRTDKEEDETFPDIEPPLQIPFIGKKLPKSNESGGSGASKSSRSKRQRRRGVE